MSTNKPCLQIFSQTGDKTQMNLHVYNARIPDDVWSVIQTIKELDSRSANSMIVEGLRYVCKDRLEKKSQWQRTRESTLSQRPSHWSV